MCNQLVLIVDFICRCQNQLQSFLLKQPTLIFITHCLISYRFGIVYIRRDILRRRAIGFLEGHELKTVARLIEKRFCKTNSFLASRFPCEAVWLSTNTR